MIRVFLDANVIFSAAYKPGRPLTRLWEVGDVELVTSGYVLTEVGRNIARKCPAQLPALEELLRKMHITPEAESMAAVELSAKDLPVLSAAIASRASFLLTGDKDFTRYLGTEISGVTILRPRAFLDRWG